MKLAEKDLLAGIVLLILNIFIYLQIKNIRWGNEQFIYSAILLPLSANILFSVLILSLILKSIVKGGRFRVNEWGGRIKKLFEEKEYKIIIIAILNIFFLTFVSVPIGAFWISGTIIMLAMLIFYVKFKLLHAIVFTSFTIASLHGIFVIIFKVPIQ